MENSKSWLDYSNKNLGTFFYKPYIVYARQFLTIIIFSLITEFIFFAIFRLVIFEVGSEYSPVIGGAIISVKVDFVSDFGRASFFILLILAFVIWIIRSNVISNAACLTFQGGKANLAIILENSVKKIKEILLLSLFLVALMIFPILLTIVALLMMPRQYYLSWGLIIAAFIVPYIFGTKVSLFNVGVAKDNLHVGTALQTSWNLTGKRNWLKTSIVFNFYVILGIIGPWAMTALFSQLYNYKYLGIIMVFVRAFLYPLFDISMTHLYLHFDYLALDEAVFKDAILEQRKRSEEFISKVKRRNAEEA
jgi:hypothetical protein